MTAAISVASISPTATAYHEIAITLRPLFCHKCLVWWSVTMRRLFFPEFRRKGITAGMPRLVVSLTSIPSRVGQLEATLRSITVGQTRRPDRVYVGLPLRSARDGETFTYDLPRCLTDPAMFDGLVSVVSLAYDHGPVCKLLAALRDEDKPETAVVVCDDDVEYAPNWLRELEYHAEQHPDAAVGFGAFDVLHTPPFFRMRFGGIANAPWLPGPSRLSRASLPRPVHCLMGIAGALYRRGHFTDEAIAKLKGWSSHDRLRRADDVTISALLSTVGVPRVLVRSSASCDAAGRDRGLSNALSASWMRAVYNHVFAFDKLRIEEGAFRGAPSIAILRPVPMWLAWLVTVTVAFLLLLAAVASLFAMLRSRLPSNTQNPPAIAMSSPT
jgi:hypothetical protein